MNIIEYLLDGHLEIMYFDENGGLYLSEEALKETEFKNASLLRGFMNKEYQNDFYDYIYLSKEDYEKLNRYSIKVDDGIEFDGNVRRPYYRMRGKSVTEEQALDIIRRTDNFFTGSVISRHKDWVGCYNFDNWLIERNHYPRGYGWIHVDGTVGSNAITQKYPELEEFVVEWMEKLMAFPYLDLIIAVTDRNECLLDEFPYPDDDKWEYLKDEFYDAIMCGIYVHDNCVELLNKKNTIAKYKEYDALYGKPKEKFVPEYYDNNKISQINMRYLRRCFEAYDLDMDKELEKFYHYAYKGIPQ